MARLIHIVVAATAALALGCAGPEDLAGPDDTEAATAALIVTGTPDGVGVVRLLNDPSTDFARLDIDARLDRRSAAGLIHHRNGPDGVYGTWDDDVFGSIEEIDAVKWVGSGALLRLLAFADKTGYVPAASELLGVYDGVAFSVAQAYAVLDVVNEAPFTTLDDSARLNARAARSIVGGRPFTSVGQLAGARYVGKAALSRLKAFSPVHSNQK